MARSLGRMFTGSYVIVRRAVVPLRMAASVASLTQRRFETGPGEQAQCDWGQITVRLGGVRAEIHIFVMTLGYSRRGFALGFLRERMGDLLAAHEAAFAHFGGRCEFLLYDRMRTVVLGTGEGRPRMNPTFASFAGHWGFTPRLCQPYRAQTKGKVESGVKYVKRNFVPGRVFRDLEDFNEQLAAWQAEVADLREHISGRSIASPTRHAPGCPPPATRASCRRWCASAWSPTTGWCPSTATATRCRSCSSARRCSWCAKAARGSSGTAAPWWPSTRCWPDALS